MAADIARRRLAIWVKDGLCAGSGDQHCSISFLHSRSQVTGTGGLNVLFTIPPAKFLHIDDQALRLPKRYTYARKHIDNRKIIYAYLIFVRMGFWMYDYAHMNTMADARFKGMEGNIELFASNVGESIQSKIKKISMEQEN